MENKRYTQANNEFTEDPNGACAGIEWTDTNGNQRRIICPSFPIFDNSLRYLKAIYIKQVKPFGFNEFINDTSNGGHVVEKVVDDNTWRFSDPTQPNFGQHSEGPVEGAITEVQFFLDNIYYNVHALPLRISDFVYQTMETIIATL